MLRAKLRAHSASVSALLVVADEPGLKEVATASLDKTLAAWRLEPDADPPAVSAQRFEAPGAPVFSLARADGRDVGSSTSGSGSGSGNGNGGGGNGSGPALWCGLATKEVVLWRPGEASFSEARMGGHTGWVRALATAGAGGRWLFSCGCNHLRQWDAAYPQPREVAAGSLFTGDILALAASGDGRRVFTAGADGSVRAWGVSRGGGKKEGGGGGGGSPGGGSSSPSVGGSGAPSPAASPTQGGSNGSGNGGSASGSSGNGGAGELRELARRERAHDGRVTALAAAGSLVFSVSHDGRIKGWDAETLHLVVERAAAHGGARVHAAAVGPDGLLYTGGDDGLVRRWDPVELRPLGAPLDGHGGAAVRALAAGRAGGECLVSGDATGHVAVWAV